MPKRQHHLRPLAALAALLLVLAGCQSSRPSSGGGNEDEPPEPNPLCERDAQCDDENDCTDDRCEDGQCAYVAAPNGMTCDDGDPCTDTDACTGGACIGVPIDCDDGVACNGTEYCDADGQCQPGEEQCSNGLLCREIDDNCVECLDDARCDDGEFCTGVEFCDADGGCRPGGDPCPGQLCRESDDTCVDCLDDADCDDGLYCSGTETCNTNGQCQDGPAPDCNDAVTCTDDSCNEGANSCDSVANDALCDDGLYCNGTESCDAALGCSSTGDPCLPGKLCNETSDTCDECQVGGDCNDSVACTDDACVGGSCVFTPNEANCPNDGLYCNGSEFCDAALDCSSTGDPCLPGGLCNETTDTCDECQVDGDCDDGVACTNDTCVGRSCVFTPNDAICPNDGLYCNGTEFCDAALDCSSTGDPCLPGGSCNETTDTCDECQVDGDCDDSVACTDDTCVGGSCVFTPNDANCPDDGLYCNGAETCDALLDCQAGTAVDCDDTVGCTDDSCNEGTDSCDNVPNDGSCDDGLYCNGAEICDALLDCQAGTAVVCSDAVGCTDDSCNEGTDSCDNVPNDSLCDDALYCNGAETCDALLDCQPGTAVDCSDAVGCTDDSCNEGTDVCDNVPNDGLCDDGLYCNGAETCDALLDCQAATAVDCDDSVGCTDDSCNEGTDSCDHAPNDGLCDDGLYCNGAETCDALLDCQPGSNPCTNPAFPVCDDGTDTCATTIDSAASRADHGGVEYYLDLALVASATVEPRQSDVTELVLQTAGSVEASSTTATAVCLNNDGDEVDGGPLTVTSSGTTTVTVDWASLPDQHCCTIDFDGGIKDSLSVRLLAGDVNGDGSVSPADKSAIKQRLGEPLDGSNFWYDVNTDGTISTADRSFVKQRFGNVAPSCP